MSNDAPAIGFYRQALDVLEQSGVEFLVGGAYSLAHYTGIERDTKDLDVFLRRRDLDAALGALTRAGYRSAIVFPHWLAKSFCGETYLDIIFSSGNGVAVVDDLWFKHAECADVLGRQTWVCPVEETIWSKAFIMERERYDGADVAHLLRCRGKQLDWRRLLDRFGTHWPVLMSYLVLYGFIYPDSQDQIPEWVRTELVGRWLRAPTEETQPAVCNGTLLSREQFLSDLEFWKYRDARQPPHGSLSESDIDRWTPGSGA